VKRVVLVRFRVEVITEVSEAVVVREISVKKLVMVVVGRSAIIAYLDAASAFEIARRVQVLGVLK
jgi:hypothetical protein